jgi:hypothetical protein
MYIAVAQGNVDPSRLDEWVAFMRTALHANFRLRPGFRNAYHGVNRERGRSMVITAWDKQEQAPTTPTAQDAAHLLADFGLQAEEILSFEVVDQV